MQSFCKKFVLCLFAGACVLLAQQDLTVQWKGSLQDLERRMTGRPGRRGLAHGR